jgi:hypothetical protein
MEDIPVELLRGDVLSHFLQQYGIQEGDNAYDLLRDAIRQYGATQPLLDEIRRANTELYRRMSSGQRRDIMRERDMEVTKPGQRVAALVEYDSIYPQWLSRILRNERDSLFLETRNIVLLAADGIDVTDLSYTKASKIMRVHSYAAPWTGRIPPPRVVRRVNTGPGSIDLKRILELTRQGLVPIRIPNRESLAIMLHASDEPLDSIIEKLAMYPINISDEKYIDLLGQNFSPTTMKDYLKAVSGYDNMLDVLDRDSLLFALTRGYLLLTEKEVSAIERYRMLTSLPRDIRDLLERVIRPLRIIARNEPTIHETYILAIQDNPLDVAKAIGMLIPAGSNPRDYIIANYPSYSLVITRDASGLRQFSYDNIPGDLRFYTDVELFQMTNAYVLYNSKGQLTSKLSRLTREPGWFIPLVRHCRNNETVIGSDTNDAEVFIVAYGTLSDYQCYELDELLTSFRFMTEDGEVTNTFIFENPAGGIFRTETMEELYHLLERWGLARGDPFKGSAEAASQLRERIREGLDSLEQRSEHDAELLARFRELSDEDKGDIRDWLDLIMNIGWYMRRWGGPGCPYPITERQTQVKIDPEERTTPALTSLQELEERMSEDALGIVYSLLLTEYNTGEPVQTDQSLRRGWVNGVIAGTHCIRMASSRFIGTAYYYLRLFFNIRDMEFQPSDVVMIV